MGASVKRLDQVLAIVRLVMARVGVLVATAIVVGISVPERGVAASSSWSAPALIDRAAPFANTMIGASLSCPSVSFCVAFGDTAVEVSRKPSKPGRWSAPRPVFSPSASSDRGFLSGGSAQVSCPSVTLCVAVSDSGQIAVSKHPGSGDWHLYRLLDASVNHPDAISCPSVSLCVAVDWAGHVITSRHPTGGSSAWKVTRVVPASRPGFVGMPSLAGVSCASVKLCVAVDTAGDVLTSRDPTGAAAWTLTNIEPKYTEFVSFLGISCSSVGSCVAVGGQDYIASSTNPAGGAAAWRLTRVSGIGSRVSCVARAFCEAIGSRRIAWSRNPFARNRRWTVRDFDLLGDAGGALACPSRSLCVGADFDLIGATTKPLAGAAAWRIDPYPGSNSLAAASCPTRSFCAAVDDGGHVLTSTRPAPARSAWRAVQAGRFSDALSDVSCPSPSLCVGLSADSLISSVHPTRGANAWRRTSLTGGALYAVSCPSVALCVATDEDGNVHVSRRPNDGARAWRTEHVDTSTRECDAPGEPCQAGLTGGISCPTASFCLTVDNAGNILTSTEPAGDASNWTVTAGVVPSQPPRTAPLVSAVSCASVHMCVIANGDGSVETSIDPTGGQSAWSRATIDAHELTDVSCASASLCVAVDLAGHVLTSHHPNGGATTWKKKTVDPGLAFKGVSCATRPLCIAVDSWGYATVTTHP